MRKMGHITVTDETIDKAIAKARNIRQLIKVVSEDHA
jgi:phosphoribosylaminoimidazole carboxylase (NCAIR synthetase)